MAQFLAVSNRKGGVGKSTIAIMLAHAAAAWSGRRVLVMDLDTQCNASLMLAGGVGWERACRAGRTIADYFYDRFDKVAEDESAYVLADVGDVAHARMAGRVSLLPGSQRLEELQGELLLKHSKKDLEADAVAVQVRGRMKRLMKHFGMDFDLVVMDCPPGLSFAALAALDLADHIVVPFRPDFVSQFALDRVAMLIERVETVEQLADIPFAERRYSCLANCLNATGGHERLLIDQLALDHPLLTVRIPTLPSIARAFDWEDPRQTMEKKFADALPYLRALHEEVLGAPQLRAKSA